MQHDPLTTPPSTAASRAWRRRIVTQQRSRLSVAEWCRAQGLAQATFYSWRRRLRADAIATPAFVELPPPSLPTAQATTPAPSPGIVELELLPDGRRVLRWPVAGAVGWLPGIVAALAGHPTSAEARP